MMVTEVIKHLIKIYLKTPMMQYKGESEVNFNQVIQQDAMILSIPQDVDCRIALIGCFNDALSIPQSYYAPCDFGLRVGRRHGGDLSREAVNYGFVIDV